MPRNKTPDADVSDVEHRDVPKPEGTPAAAPAAAGVTDLSDILGDLDQQAGAASREAFQQAAQQEAREVDTLATDLVDALMTVQPMAQHLAWWMPPEAFDQLWGRQVLERVAEPAAVLMRRHGLTLGDAMSKWGPWLAIVGAVAPSAAATVMSYRHARAQQAAAARQPQGASDGTQAP